MGTKDKAVAVAEQPRAVQLPPERQAIRNALLERLPNLLPEGTSVDRFIAMTMQAIAKQPDLADCDPTSVVMSALEAAQIGLEPTGGIGGAWLVGFRTNEGTQQQPRWVKKAQLILDYRGVQHLIREGGGGEVKAVLVYEGDAFHVYEGTRPRIEHEPRYETSDPTKVTHVYAWPLNSPDKFEVMTREQIEGIRARSKSGNRGPWVTDWGQQARKTVIKRLGNYLSLKPSTRLLLEQDSEREFGNDVAPSEPVGSRTASIKASVAKRLGAGQPAENAPGPDEKGDPPSDAPAASAGEQTAENETTRAETQEVCGATSDPALGDEETCVLPPDHAFPDGKPSAHQSAAGTKFPPKGGAK
jgi:recombination protein RecT